MDIKQEVVRLRLYMGADKMHGGQPLYEAIVKKARECQLAGVTVVRGTEGYGRSTRLHSAEVLFSDDTPIVIEFVDSEARIDAFVALLDTITGVALVTYEKITALLRR
jgi:PII-like signaling protein